MTKRRDWRLTEIYPDNDISGAGCKKRSGFQKLITDIELGLIDAVVAQSGLVLSATAHVRAATALAAKAEELKVESARERTGSSARKQNDPEVTSSGCLFYAGKSLSLLHF